MPGRCQPCDQEKALTAKQYCWGELSDEDISHYKCIVNAIEATDMIINKIDQIGYSC